MIKSYFVMDNIGDICSELRNRFYGSNASPKDYKESFVINHSVESFIASPQRLMSKDIEAKEKSSKKMPKSINLRSSCSERVSLLAKTLNISESEVIRRILYYTVLNEDQNADKTSDMKLSEIKDQLTFLRSQVKQQLQIIDQILVKLNDSEEG